MARLASPPLDAASRRWCTGAAVACALPLLPLLPAWLALTLIAVGILAAWSGARRPLPPWLRLVLTLSLAGVVLTVFGFRFGRDTGSALLLAMLALKLGETISLRDARSLVGFAAFAPFAAFLLDQGPRSLLLALPAALLVLATSRRLAEAEAGVSAIRPRAHLAAAGRALALALPLALAGFWLFPRLPAPWWGLPENAIGKTGLSDRMEPGDFTELLVDDSPAFRVRFDGPAPPVNQMYWRGPVLWNFDGRAWTRWDGYASLDPAPVESVGPELRYEVMLEPTERRYLLALDLPTAAPPGARLGTDYTMYALRPVRSLLQYELSSAPPTRFDANLRPILRRTALDLPPERNPRAHALARQWRAETASDAQVIQRALAWFNREFIYSLEAVPLGRDSVDEFLFDTRIGYCEHFSSAFAVLMRAAGIPARIVTGYAGGYRNRIGDYWLVRQSDAHAWTEVWLPERGWVRVDPTAAVAPERVFETVDDLAAVGGGLGALRRMWDVGDWLTRGWNDFVLGFDAARQALLLRPFGIDQARTWQVGSAFMLVTGLAMALTLLLLLRERGPRRDPLLAAWADLTARLARAGAGKAAHEPPLAWADRIAVAWPPAQAEALLALSRRFAAWRYAGAELDAEARARLLHDLRSYRPPRLVHATGVPSS